MNKSKVSTAMSDLSKLNGLDWLVAARNEIQSFMLDLYNHMPKPDESDFPGSKTPVDWHLFLGSAFSLWRAVFLVETSDVSRNTNEVAEQAADFLKKVIETNAIAFTDEFRQRSWSRGYYLNNARYSVKTLLGDHSGGQFLEVPSSAPLKDLWNETFVALQKAFLKAVT